MKKNKIIITVSISLIAVLFISFVFLQENNFEQKREKVLSALSQSIEEAEAEGKYECCIEPPCTMCYLGHWLWEDGICRCDEMIAKGELDKVCPQCGHELESGNCSETSEAETWCET